MQYLHRSSGLRLPGTQPGHMFQAGVPGGYFMPAMHQPGQRFFAPGMNPQARPTPRWAQPPIRGQQAAMMQQMGGAGQMRPPRPPQMGQPQVRPVSLARPITGGQPLSVVQQHRGGQVMMGGMPPMAMQRGPGGPFKFAPTARNPPGQIIPGQTQAVLIGGQEPLTASMLSEAPPQEQKQMLGERLFPLISQMYPDLAGKITGMLLEIDNSELLHMLESRESLKAKVEEAVAVLQAHQAKEAEASKA